MNVITSYSIHYTKLYELECNAISGRNVIPRSASTIWIKVSKLLAETLLTLSRLRILQADKAWFV